MDVDIPEIDVKEWKLRLVDNLAQTELVFVFFKLIVINSSVGRES